MIDSRNSEKTPRESGNISLRLSGWMSGTQSKWLVGFILVAGLLVLGGCGGGKSKSEEAIEEIEQEIQQLFANFKKAGQENDFNALFGYCSPETVKLMIFEAIRTMGTTAQSKESEQLLASYIDQKKLMQIGDTLKNPTQDQVIHMYMSCISNPREMFIDSYQLIQKLNPDRTKPEYGELKDLKIVGNIASGKTTAKTTTVELKTLPGQGETTRVEKTETRDIEVYFIRIQGEWFFATKREWSGIGG